MRAPIRPRRTLPLPALIARDEARLAAVRKFIAGTEQLVLHALALVGATCLVGAVAQSLPALFPGAFQ